MKICLEWWTALRLLTALRFADDDVFNLKIIPPPSALNLKKRCKNPEKVS